MQRTCRLAFKAGLLSDVVEFPCLSLAPVQSLALFGCMWLLTVHQPVWFPANKALHNLHAVMHFVHAPAAMQISGGD